mmetsp:Transcript_36530/g.94859  ORF Transcript_36530/g.94859 Transcript_36530/m.94859 type:complete len:314 (-) Transcript_36530:125-1066(-)
MEDPVVELPQPDAGLVVPGVVRRAWHLHAMPPKLQAVELGLLLQLQFLQLLLHLVCLLLVNASHLPKQKHLRVELSGQFPQVCLLLCVRSPARLNADEYKQKAGVARLWGQEGELHHVGTELTRALVHGNPVNGAQPLGASGWSLGQVCLGLRAEAPEVHDRPEARVFWQAHRLAVDAHVAKVFVLFQPGGSLVAPQSYRILMRHPHSQAILATGLQAVDGAQRQPAEPAAEHHQLAGGELVCDEVREGWEVGDAVQQGGHQGDPLATRPEARHLEQLRQQCACRAVSKAKVAHLLQHAHQHLVPPPAPLLGR